VATTLNTTTLRQAIGKWPGVQRIVDLNVAWEDWWFDFYHHVDTSAQSDEQMALGWPADKLNFHYLPIRPKCARRALRNLRLKNRREYIFIDFGSGNGRMLFVAARHGFTHLCGIELRRELHNQASKNARECRHVNSGLIESLNINASVYEFPDEKLVLFFFNPFGSEVMAKVLEKLTDSLDRHFRDVWVVLHDSTCAYLADQSPKLRFETARHGYRIYRSIPGRSVSDHVVRNGPPREIGRPGLLD
jgi:predicted RNA methylase